MKRLLLCGFVVGTFALSHDATAQAGISLGAAVGASWRDNKLQTNDERHGLVYVKLGVPLVPYGARADFLVMDTPLDEYDMAVIGSAVVSINAPLIQPYVLLGFGRYGLKSTPENGVSYGGGLRFGGRRGFFIEGRRHEPINRALISIGLAF